MSVEGGGIGGGGIGSGVATAVGIGGLSVFGPKLTGPEFYAPTIVNEGPVASSFLENSVTLAKFNPVGEIQFNSPSTGQAVIEPLQLSNILTKENVLAQENQILGIVEPEIVRPSWGTVTPQEKPLVIPQVLPEVGFPSLEPETRQENALGVQPKAETAVSSKIAPTTLTQPKTQEIDEVEEKVAATEDQQTEDEIEDSTESFLKVKFVEAVNVSQKRKKKLRAAIKRVIKEGKRLREFLSVGFWNDKSPIVGEGEDGTLELTVKSVESNLIEDATSQQLEQIVDQAVEENIPVEQGEGGRDATVEDIEKVIKGKKSEVAAKTPAEIVIKRIVKKKVVIDKTGVLKPLVNEDKTEVNGEVSLRELSPKLAEVFQKAA